MAGLLDKMEIELPCHKCGRKTKKTAAWVKSNRQFTCSCGAVTSIKADRFNSGISEAESLLGSLGKKKK